MYTIQYTYYILNIRTDDTYTHTATYRNKNKFSLKVA